ncbi:hypothetical protein Gpo141_00012558 [Globisporangium polare]
MVDKDLNEIRVLRSYSPEARILVCLVHVIKWLNLALKKVEYGKISAEEHTAVDPVVHSMVYAASADIYDTQRTSLSSLWRRIGFGAYFGCMEKN